MEGKGAMDSANNNANNNNNNNWRNELSQDSRQKIVNKIMDSLQRHMPFTGPDGVNELRKIALRLEQKIYAAATDQQDYLRRISLKMLSLVNHVSRDANPLEVGFSISKQKPLDLDVQQLKSGKVTMDLANNNAYNDNNWRNELSQDSRHKIVNKIMDTLQRHMPFTGPDGMNEIRKIALRFEEKIYTAAGNQQDYLRQISLKMLSLKNPVSRDAIPLAGGSSSSYQKRLDPELLMEPQLRNTSHLQALVNGNAISLPGQSQPQQTLLPQNFKAGMSASGMQSSSGLLSTVPSLTNLSQITSEHVFGTHSAPNNPTEWILSKDVPFTGPDGMNELRKIVLPFEEKIYAAAMDQKDYLRKISLKALSLRNHVSRDGNPLAEPFSNSN